jgi:hypothetical protein
VLTLPAATVKVVDVEPCGTVTLAGTVAAVVFELESDTTTPPLPAAKVRLTVPVPDWPLTIVPGLTDKLARAGAGLTVRPTVALAPEYEAIKVTGVEALTVRAVTANVAEVDPWGTVTLEGTLAAVVLELVKEIVTPPVPAAAVMSTVAVPAWPLTIVLGLTEMLASAAGIGLTVTPKVTLAPE